MAVGRRGQLLFPSSFFLVKKFFSSGKLRNRAGDDPYRTLPRARNGPSGGGTAAVCRYCACVRVTVPRISGLGVGQLRNAAAHRTSISRRVMPPRPVNEKLFSFSSFDISLHRVREKICIGGGFHTAKYNTGKNGGEREIFSVVFRNFARISIVRN